MSFPFLYILNSLQSSLTVYILPRVGLLVKETAEIETGIAEESSWDQANIPALVAQCVKGLLPG
jgi:hypothetical protein